MATPTWLSRLILAVTVAFAGHWPFSDTVAHYRRAPVEPDFRSRGATAFARRVLVFWARGRCAAIEIPARWLSAPTLTGRYGHRVVVVFGARPGFGYANVAMIAAELVRRGVHQSRLPEPDDLGVATNPFAAIARDVGGFSNVTRAVKYDARTGTGVAIHYVQVRQIGVN